MTRRPSLRIGGGPASEAGPAKLPDTFVLAVLLFPGFVTERVVDYFAATPKLDNVQLIASALAATLLNLGLLLVLARPFDRFLGWKRQAMSELVLRPPFIVAISAVSIVTGLAWAIIENNGAIYKLTRRIESCREWYCAPVRISHRVERTSTWEYAFHQNAGRRCPNSTNEKDAPCPWKALVMTKRGEVFFGRPAGYAETSDYRELFLEDAYRVYGMATTDKPQQGGSASPAHSLAGATCVPVGTYDEKKNVISGAVVVTKDQVEFVEFHPDLLLVKDGKGMIVDPCSMSLHSKKSLPAKPKGV